MQKINQILYRSDSTILEKVKSTPSIASTSESSCSSESSYSSENIPNQFRETAVKLIIQLSKQIEKDTQYLAISYVHELIKKGITFGQDDYETVSVACLLLACKMNEIAVPKLSYMFSRCKKLILKEEVINMEAHILSAFNFDIAIQKNPYIQILQILGSKSAEWISECDKLLKIVAVYGDLQLFEDQMLAHSVVYLVSPQSIKDVKWRQLLHVKTLSKRIYSLYSHAKQQYKLQRQNQAKKIK